MSGTRRRRRWLYGLGGIALVLAVTALVFRWDWLIPTVEARLSARVGRPVRIGHLHVTPGRQIHVVADDVAIENPAGWPGGGQFASAEHVVLDFDAGRYLRSGALAIGSVTLERPSVDAVERADGAVNWAIAGGTGRPVASIGRIAVNDGTIRVSSAPRQINLEGSVVTREERAADGGDSAGVALEVRARGLVRTVPVAAEMIGGGPLALLERRAPYPARLRLTSGPATLAAEGMIQDAPGLSGTQIKVEVAGPDVSLLLPADAAGSKAEPFRVAGTVRVADGRVSVADLAGRLGSSDLGGTLELETGSERPVLTARLQSRLLDWSDLGGVAGALAAGLSDLDAADAHVAYRAAQVERRRRPSDGLDARLDVVNGRASLHPLRIGIGKGELVAEVAVEPGGSGFAVKAEVTVRRVDVGRLLDSEAIADGAGVMGGRATLAGTGRTAAEVLAQGTGEARLYMGAGGSVTALLTDVLGSPAAGELISALGLPTPARIGCGIADLALTTGRMQPHLALLDTDRALLRADGEVDLAAGQIAMAIRTEPKQPGLSMPAEVAIMGRLSQPEVTARAGAAAPHGLGVTADSVAALLPAVETATEDSGACAGLQRDVAVRPATAAAPAPAPRARKHPRRLRR